MGTSIDANYLDGSGTSGNFEMDFLGKENTAT